MRSSQTMLWAAFTAFAGCALYVDQHENLFTLYGPLAPVKAAVWIAFVGFLVFTIYCSTQENLFRTIEEIGEMHWGRQIGLDLYLGVFLTTFVVYLNEASLLVALCWLLPFLLFANLATLLYFAIHFEEIVARFLA